MRARRATRTGRQIATVGAAALAATVMSTAGAAVGAPVPAAVPGPLDPAWTEVDLLNINDFHGRIDTDGTGKLGKGFACTIETERQALGETQTLLLGAGDLIGASPFTSASQQDVPTLQFLNAVGLNAAGVGNHEFDRGFPDLRDRVIPMSAFQYLGANVYRKGTTTPAMQTYRLFTIKGVRVAVIGAVTSETPSLVGADGISELDFGDPVTGVNRVADLLRDGDEGNGEADVIVAEYHEGAPVGEPASTYEAQHDESAVFRHLVDDTSAKVDVIMQGHTHQQYVWDAPIPGGTGTRPVLQTGNYAQTLGRIKVGVDPTTKKMAGYEASLVPVTATDTCAISNTRVTEAFRIVDEAVAKAKVVGEEEIGSVTADITTAFGNGGTTRDDRQRESTLSNLIAQSQVESLNAPGRPGGVDIGVMNPGGVRQELRFDTDGKITFAEAATIMPFGNTIKTTELTGAQFTQVLEEQWQPTGASRPFLKLGLSKNVSYTYDPNAAAGSRVLAVWVDGAPIDPAKTYVVAANSFLIPATGDGGDNFFTMGRGANEKDSGFVDQNMFVDYIRDNSPLSPDFHKLAVATIDAPTSVTPGQEVSFETEGYDLTSLGSPDNTSVEIFLGSTAVGTATITSGLISGVPTRDGKATIEFTVPATAASGATEIKLVAQPTGTTVHIPVTVAGRSGYTPVDPTRLLDTRSGVGAPKAIVPAGGTVTFDVTGASGIPAGVDSVALNVTAVADGGSGGYVTAYEAGTTAPVVSNVNYVAGRPIANQVIVKVSDDGKVTLRTSGRTNLIADAVGYIPTGSKYTALTPTRVVDTRTGTGATGPIAAGSQVDLQIRGQGGVPTEAAGVVVNLTAVSPAGQGYLTAWATGLPRPSTSDLNYVGGRTTAGLTIVPLGADGKITVRSSQSTQLLVDVIGWAPLESEFRVVTPVRALSHATTAAGGTQEVKVTGGDVPADARAVMAVVTVVAPSGGGYVTVWPTGTTRPGVSTQNYAAGETVSNSVLAKVGADGKISVRTTAGAKLIVDVLGFVQ